MIGGSLSPTGRGSGRGGILFFNVACDIFKHCVEVFQHIVVGDPQDPVAALFERFLTPHVAFPAMLVAPPVDFDDYAF